MQCTGVLWASQGPEPESDSWFGVDTSIKPISNARTNFMKITKLKKDK